MNEILSEQALRDVVALVGRVVEAGGAFVIFSGVLLAFVRFAVTALRDRRAASFVPIRLDLGRFLALGLEFQLASDILRTAIGPTFRQIGELAAIAAIRTALNYFLAREIRAERAEIDGRKPNQDEPSGPERSRSVEAGESGGGPAGPMP